VRRCGEPASADAYRPGLRAHLRDGHSEEVRSARSRSDSAVGGPARSRLRSHVRPCVRGGGKGRTAGLLGRGGAVGLLPCDLPAGSCVVRSSASLGGRGGGEGWAGDLAGIGGRASKSLPAAAVERTKTPLHLKTAGTQSPKG
jgi:hypothetical protein